MSFRNTEDGVTTYQIDDTGDYLVEPAENHGPYDTAAGALAAYNGTADSYTLNDVQGL